MGQFCTSEAVTLKAGADVSTSLTTQYDTLLIPYAESYVCNVCRYNYRDNYTSLTSDAALLLADVSSDLAAIEAIRYDMSGYESRMMAIDMINVLRANAKEKLEVLKNNEDFILNA